MFPKSVLEQAQYDAGIARKNDPNRNAFQRAQDFLRSKLTGKPAPSPSQRTPQQQAEFDAREGRRIQKQQNTKKITKTGRVLKDTVLSGNSLKNTVVGGVAQSAGVYLAGKLVESAGTPGAARMSKFGLGPTGNGSDAPVYETPFNTVEASGNITRIGGKEYDLSDPTQKAAYDKVIAADRASRPGQKMADIRGGGGLNPDGSGRTMPAPDGNGSTGTNTGFKGADFGEANGLLARLGITTTRYGDFQSNDLPGVENTEFGGSDREIFGGTAEEDRIIQRDGSLKTVIDAKQTQGSPKLTQSAAQSITSTVETAPLGSLQRYGQEFLQDRPDMPADKSTSMTGLRAAEASKGLLYASGQYWKENPDAGKEGEKDFIKIEKDEWNSIKRGEQHAQEFLQQKMGPVKSEISLTDKQDDYQITDASKPTSSIDSTAQVDTSQITNAPTLTDAVDVSFTDKDRTGRYNLFR